MSKLLLAVLAFVLWWTWPADYDDRLGFVVIMSAIMPFGLPLWAIIAFWWQAVLFALGALILAKE